MAGYKPKDKIYRLKFTDPEYEGLEVDTVSASMGDVLLMQEKAAEAAAAKNEGNLKETVAATREMMKLFSRVIKSWNLLDADDQPVPTTFDGLASQSDELVGSIFKAWMTRVAGVSAPLDVDSPSGGTSQEASHQLASLSQSRPS